MIWPLLELWSFISSASASVRCFTVESERDIFLSLSLFDSPSTIFAACRMKGFTRVSSVCEGSPFCNENSNLMWSLWDLDTLLLKCSLLYHFMFFRESRFAEEHSFHFLTRTVLFWVKWHWSQVGHSIIAQNCMSAIFMCFGMVALHHHKSRGESSIMMIVLPGICKKGTDQTRLAG